MKLKLYVEAASKRAINSLLSKGEPVYGDVYRPDGTSYGLPITSLQAGDVIVRYRRKLRGQPQPVAWHQWNAEKQRVVS